MKHYLSILLIMVVQVRIVEARFITEQEANVTVSKSLYIHVNKDGTANEFVTKLYTINNESGKEQIKMYQMIFEEDEFDLKIIEAKSTHDNKDFIIDNNLIEYKPLSSNPDGFSKRIN